jgi:hypothetical protein
VLQLLLLLLLLLLLHQHPVMLFSLLIPTRRFHY